jgi:hypothetical protein
MESGRTVWRISLVNFKVGEMITERVVAVGYLLMAFFVGSPFLKIELLEAGLCWSDVDPWDYLYFWCLRL